jgi:hypothetical protein
MQRNRCPVDLEALGKIVDNDSGVVSVYELLHLLVR